MISIIVPVLNEADGIVEFLAHITDSATSSKISEVIIVDGGSSDGTPRLVNEYASTSRLEIKLIDSEKGRARQMNKGAQIARGGVLYFLHADSFPPKGYDTAILAETQNGNPAGCFRMRFDRPHPVLKISQWFTRFNFKFCRGGDQSLFVNKEIFDTLSGYDESYTIYEDCELINRIYDHYSFVVINNVVTTSARKYIKNGTMKLQYHFTVIHLKKIMGASPENLSNYYHRNISS